MNTVQGGQSTPRDVLEPFQSLDPPQLFSMAQRLLSRLTWSEASGALGDLGTFLPLLLGLVRNIGLDLGTTLIVTGLYNVITGFHFDIPMPVQPMKTIAAVALSEGSLTIPELVSAGITVSGTVFILGITGGMALFNRLVPFSLVRGIQLGVGLRLGIRGVKMVFYEPDSADWRPYFGPEGLVLGLFGAVFILLTTLPVRHQTETAFEEDPSVRHRLLNMTRSWLERSRRHVLDSEKGETEENRSIDSRSSSNDRPAERGDRRRVPAALLLVLLGIVLVFAFGPSVVKSLRFGPSKPSTVVPTWEEFKNGFWRAGLPQLPLTTLNSVVAVCKLSEELFPHRPANPTTVATSVGIMNFIGTWFGVMPCCHGAGGLAAQAKFGAKTGMAPIILGMAKIVLGLLFGSSLYTILHKFPLPLLGSMLVFSGIELAACCRSENEMRGVSLMLITAAGIFATGNTGIGFLIGTAAYFLIAIYDFMEDAMR